MNESSAEKLANVVIAVAVVGAASYIMRTPRLRRMAWRLAVTALTGAGPAWLGQEIRDGWRDSARGPALARDDAPGRRDMMAG